MVPKDNVTRLRMKLAEGGLPKGGGVGYEIFDKSDALGTTSFVQNINHLRALEGELARTIRAIDRVQAARVHLVLPERPLFPRETPEPSASIALRVRGALEPQQIRAIRHLVASAVNGLKPQRVSIVDEAGQLLADGAGERQRRARRRRAPRRRTRSACASRSRRSSSSSSAPAAPACSLPPISTTTGSPRPRTSSIRKAGCCARPRPARNPPPPPATTARSPSTTNCRATSGQDGGAERPDQSKKSEETNNYEISRTTKTEVTEAGRVNRISVAVLVDGVYCKNEKGEMVYQERGKEELDRIAALVRSAIGFDQKRGDQVEVVNLSFAEAPAVAPINEPTGLFGMLQFTKDDVMYVIELGVMMLLSLVVLFMVIRPLVKRILAPEVIPALTSDAAAPALTDGAQAAGPARTWCRRQPRNMIDVAQVQGQVHAQSVHRVGELAERNPNETATIVRQWLTRTGRVI